MPRPHKFRRLNRGYSACRFKPQGLSACELDVVCLSQDEIEAVRLADFDGLYQAEAAELMNVSRQTFGNIVKSARGKIADALINGKVLEIIQSDISQQQIDNDIFFSPSAGRRGRRRS